MLNLSDKFLYLGIFLIFLANFYSFLVKGFDGVLTASCFWLGTAVWYYLLKGKS